MKVKDRFSEGWIMLKRPFDFGNLSKPLQKMTILYAYSEKPIIKIELTKKGRELVEEAYDNIDKTFGMHSTPRERTWHRGFGEKDDSIYEQRVDRMLNIILEQHSTVEVYEGQIVQCEVEGEMCRFYPDEYAIIQRDTFEYVLTSKDYDMEIENKSPFTTSNIKTKLFYIMNRGIDKSMAERMVSGEMKDAVIFRPGEGILQMFCREHEIYRSKVKTN